jgi:ABC-type amino acid transport substrate-binding protein
LFSNPYLILHPVIILNRLKAANFTYRKNVKLKGLIGEKKGTSYIDFARFIFDSPVIKEFNTWGYAIKELLEGNIFAILRDEVGVKNIFMESPSLSIKLKTITLQDFNDNIAIAINPNYWHLHYWLNLFLKSYKNEKNVEKIILNYKKLR